MDDETRKQALRLLEDLVLDSGEAVSYRRLASALCIHANLGKVLLQEFVDQYADAKGLSVSVLVCGATSGASARIVMCPREEVKNVRASLNTVLFEHIYAVSRASAALEGAALAAAAGGFDDFTPTIGAISSSECTKRSEDEIGKLKLSSYRSLTDAKPAAGSSKTSSKDVDNNKVLNSIMVVNKQSEKPSTAENSNASITKPLKVENLESNSKPKVTAKGQSKKDISNFFNKNNGQAVEKISKIKEEAKPKVEDSAKNNGFRHSTQVTIDKRVSETKNDVPQFKKLEKEAKKPEKQTKPTEKEAKKPEKQTKPTEKVTKKPEKSEGKKSTKRRDVVSAHRNGKVDKKRKRVMLMSDSEDSEEDKDDPFEETPTRDVNMDSDEDVIPATPNADVVKITSGIVNPKKRRKIVDKTYTTEDGYMVTRKEEILESCSEDEVEMKENNVDINVKKQILVEKKTPALTPKINKKKTASPQKGKQASITNFFKKKP